MKPKIWNDITNILAKLASSKDYDPKVKYETALEFYGNQIPVLPKPGAGDNGKSVVAKTDGTYELKKPAVTPADIIAATGEMTSQQAATTLGNIGGEPEKLIVTVTESGGVYSADKTFAEILAAYAAGKTLSVNRDDDGAMIYRLFFCNEYVAAFILAYQSSGWLIVETIAINSDDTIDNSIAEYAPAPTTIIDPSLTSITLASAADNTIYSYGELTALTVTAITNPGQFIISWRSGSTPTVHNFPTTMRFPTADNAMEACEANTDYEVNCRNGKCVVTAWPVVSP